MNTNKINLIVEEIKSKLDELLFQVHSISVEAAKESPPGTSLDPSIEIAPQEQVELQNLKKLLQSEEWPEAVSEFQIVNINSEEEKMDRAEGIVDILVSQPLSNKKFLDYGCGEGHMAKYASKESLFSVGYDLAKPSQSKFDWEVEENNCLLTTDFEKVKEKGPYDIIVIYDVIDHADNPEEILSNAKNLLNTNGKIYMRCHPWCGRHGGHYYRQINKAFVHLVFTEEELNEMGYKLEEKNRKLLFPIREYENLIKNSGLVKDGDPEIERQKVEDFFEKNKDARSRIIKLFKNNAFPHFQMEQCFHDYVLRK